MHVITTCYSSGNFNASYTQVFTFKIYPNYVLDLCLSNLNKDLNMLTIAKSKKFVEFKKMDDKGVWQATAFINIQSFSESLEKCFICKN